MWKNSQEVNNNYNNIDNNNYNNIDNNVNCKSKEDFPVGSVCSCKNEAYQPTIFIKESVKDENVYVGLHRFGGG